MTQQDSIRLALQQLHLVDCRINVMVGNEVVARVEPRNLYVTAAGRLNVDVNLSRIREEQSEALN